MLILQILDKKIVEYFDEKKNNIHGVDLIWNTQMT